MRKLTTDEEKRLVEYFQPFRLTLKWRVLICVYVLMLFALILGVAYVARTYGVELPPLPPGTQLMYTGV